MWPDLDEHYSPISAAGLVLNAMQSVPINLPSLAREMDIALISIPLDPELQCYIAPEGEGFRIFVNANHTPNRQRFSAAHAIGHLVWHRGSVRRGGGCNDDLNYRGNPKFPHFNPEITAQHDRKANNFAVMLLMPEKKVLELYQLAPDNIPGIARFIGVSTEALSLRLASLLRKDHVGRGPRDLRDEDGGHAALQELPL